MTLSFVTFVNKQYVEKRHKSAIFLILVDNLNNFIYLCITY